jgi:ABC-type uncharacterized transport system permease subunit
MLAEVFPNPGQITLLAAAIALVAAGWLLSLARLRWTEHSNRFRITAKACTYFGLLVALGVLVWHSLDRGNWVPLGDNFDALIWLGLLLTLFVLYMQRAHPLGGLDWFVLPAVILLFAGAAFFGQTNPHGYDVKRVWLWVHLVTSFGGAAAFTVAGAFGVMYLLANRRLRRKRPPAAGTNFGSLERLERLTLIAVSLGFALLTIGGVLGLVDMANARSAPPAAGRQWFFDAKVLLSVCVWVVYALVLHSPINPSFRGRRTAILSVLGFVLTVGTIVAVQFMET